MSHKAISLKCFIQGVTNKYNEVQAFIYGCK